MPILTVGGEPLTVWGEFLTVGGATAAEIEALTPKTPLSLGAIVTLLEETPDGQRIQLLRPAWLEIGRLVRERGLEALAHLDPRQWEELVAARYDAEGYEVELTPRSGDGGKDVIAVKRGFGSVRIFDQVKAVKPGGRVTAEEVRALLGVVVGDPKVTRGVLTTTATFAPGIATDKSIQPFIPFRLDLVDGPALTKALIDLTPKV